MKNNKRKISDDLVRTLLLFALVFYTFWAVMELAIIPFLDKTIANEVINTFIVDVVIKNLTWTLPAILLLHRFGANMYVEPQKLFTMDRDKKKWWLAVPVVIAYGFVLAFTEKGGIKISSDFGLSSVLVVLFVGLTEETVFRGWLLNAMYQEDNKVIMVLVNALMFLAIHFPKWLRAGSFIAIFTSGSFLTIIMLSILFSILFVKSKSLLVPMVAHSVYDLIVMMLC